MKRSLPVILCVAGVLLVALLISNGFLSLPGSGDDPKLADASKEERSKAPLVDPESLEVEYEDPQKDEEKKKSKNKDKKDRKNKNKKDRKDRKDRKGDGKGKRGDDRSPTNRKGEDAGPRSTPKVGDRNPDRKGEPADPKPRKNKNGGPSPNPSPKGPPPASVTVTDLAGDPEGEGKAPGYMDIETVALSQTEDLMIAELTFTKRVPAAMPNGDVNMLTSIEVDRGDRKVSVYAESSENGWTAHTNRSAAFPGSMEISGDTIRFTLPRSFFGNEFSWYAHSSWTKSTTTKTDYFFDFAPDDQNGEFPSGGTT